MGPQAESPEGRMWGAVIMTAFHDAKVVMETAKIDIDLRGKVSRQTKREFQVLHREISHSHFADICSFMGVAHDRFLKSFYKEMEKAGLKLSDFYSIIPKAGAL